MSIKGIVITADNDISVQEFEEPLYKSAGAVIGADLVEHVRPPRLPSPYCMYVDEEGVIKGLPINSTAGWLCGHIIVGTVIIFKDGIAADGEPDTISLEDEDIEELVPALDEIAQFCEGCGE